MYGKFFSSTFTGSMYGAGTTVFAVWGYVIANTVDSRVELNPKLLASVLGTTPESIVDAIDALCKPDPLSRNGAAEGRRLQQEGTFQYRVTSHEIYRAMRNEEERREYNRLKQRESRAKRAVKHNVNDGQRMSTMSAHTEAEAEAEADTEAETKTDPGSLVQQATKTLPEISHLSSANADYEAFTALYPGSRRVGGKQARSAFKAAQSKTTLEVLTSAVEAQKRSKQWSIDKIIPLMTTWLNQERWNQTLPEVKPYGQSAKTAGNVSALQRFAARPR